MVSHLLNEHCETLRTNEEDVVFELQENVIEYLIKYVYHGNLLI